MFKLLALLGACFFLWSTSGSDAEAATWKGHHVKRCHTRHRHGHVVRRGHGRHRHKVVRCHRVWKVSREYRRRTRIVRLVKSKTGHPYVWGATGPYSFDCSGLAVWAYRKVGIYLPRTTYSQLARLGHKHRHIRKGDLVYRGNHHMGVYIGHGTVIHATHPGSTVRRIGTWYFNHYRSAL